MQQLEVKDITVHYGTAQAVGGVTISVDDGAVVSIIGANGAGKSTIMNAISGLIPITKGEIWFNGIRIDKMKTHLIVKSGLVQVPEGKSLFPAMSVLSNLRLGAYLRTDKDGIRNDLEEMYARFPILAKRRSQLAGTLSGGEQQMLAIARALMAKPKLLLLDEPSLGLSPIMIAEVARVIETINRSGISILLVEQNAGLVRQVADRGYVMEVGRIVHEGSLEQLMTDKLVQRAFLG
jgi:branched-chain amino acid transport system ATP-binding protein